VYFEIRLNTDDEDIHKFYNYRRPVGQYVVHIFLIIRHINNDHTYLLVAANIYKGYRGGKMS